MRDSSYLNVRVLDPLTAYQVVDQPPTQPTTFVADALLVRGFHEETLRALDAAAAEAGFSLQWDPSGQEEAAALARAAVSDAQREQLREVWVRRVRLVPDPRDPVFKPIDTWRLLQSYRVRVGRDSARYGDVALDHPALADTVVTGHPVTASHPITASHPVTASHPITASHPVTASHGVDQYAAPGWGGRQPVSWLGAEPAPAYDLDSGTPRPVVAVLDTGIGRHAWLRERFVEHHVTVMGLEVGIDPVSAQAALHGVGNDMVGELDRDSGHGTFIAGLVRQACPEALILDIPTYGNDGRVAESDLLACLQRLALRQVLARNGVEGYVPVDVVSLSLGYYHEQPDDAGFDPLLLGPLRLLGRYGVAVVASAGNDATRRPSYPAAFAPHPGGLVPDDPEVVPVSTVGARNPDGSIALFSNDGPWVGYLRPGASLVSTFPDTYDASANPSHEVRLDNGEVRAAFDPDDFSSGFGVWSGTSFAAPVLAGEIAAALARVYQDGNDDLGTDAAVTRLRTVLAGLRGRELS